MRWHFDSRMVGGDWLEVLFTFYGPPDRIALGAHYFTDVLAGMFFGSVWLTLCFVVLRPFRRNNLSPVIENVLAEPSHELVPVPASVQVDAIVVSTANNSFIQAA
jgi:hypothetical protein